MGQLSRNELRYLVRASDNEGLAVSIMEHLTAKVHQFVNVSRRRLRHAVYVCGVRVCACA